MSLIDARTFPAGTTLETGVCVIGAGAAGIAIARELAHARVDVCVLESGGLEGEPAVQDLSRGEIAGAPYCPLDANRTRALGGTTHLWSGWCRPLDPLDFQTRSWVPGSGWPLHRDELLPYYRRARALCELPPGADGLRAAPLPLDPDRIVTRLYELSPPTRFGQVYREELAAAERVRVLLHAVALELHTDATGSAVTSIRVGSLGGHRFVVVARRYVLAAGGIENARLLLVSDRAQAAGVGNVHDLVGRYFMEHVHFHSGWLRLAPEWRRRAALYWPGGTPTIARLSLSPGVQAGEGLLGWNAFLERRRRGRQVASALLRRERTAWPRGRELLHATSVRVHETVEPLPDPHSRITLSAARDVLGMRRVRLDWRPRAEERATCRRARAVLDEALRQAGVGRLDAVTADDERGWPPPPLQGTRGHHMGTTRMSDDPRRGVVDARCRVHGVANLHVAGSSVFPTGGAGTPTLTILALALRLADDLAADR